MALPAPITPFSGTVDVCSLADQADDLISKHCILTEHERTAIVLWSLSTFGYDNYRIFPRLALISPERRCGKTTTLEVISTLCKMALSSSNLTPATIIRLRALTELTLIIDEADTFIKNAEGDIKGILNSGHNRSTATAIRCTGDAVTPTVFDVWYPIVVASIGALHDTLMDRSLVINLKRKRPTDITAPVPPNLSDQMLLYRQQALAWFIANEQALKANQIRPHYRGNDRAVDNWVPLFTLVNQMSEYWQQRCLSAYENLVQEDEMELPTRLLHDIRRVWSVWADETIPSQELLNELLKDDTAPWGSEKLQSGKVARMLAPYNIKPKDIRFGSRVLRGYRRDQFTDAFDRYLPPLT